MSRVCVMHEYALRTSPSTDGVRSYRSWQGLAPSSRPVSSRPPARIRLATEEPNERTLGAAVVVGRSHGNVRRLELDAVLDGQQAHVRRVTYRRDESQPASPSAAARMQRPRHPPGFWSEPKPERPLHPPGVRLWPEYNPSPSTTTRFGRARGWRTGDRYARRATTRFGRARASRAVNWT
jgi:hypothetical protein